jgi:hypothetical protein
MLCPYRVTVWLHGRDGGGDALKARPYKRPYKRRHKGGGARSRLAMRRWRIYLHLERESI